MVSERGDFVKQNWVISITQKLLLQFNDSKIIASGL